MRFPFPLALVAAMLVIAAGIEIFLKGAPDLTSKLPLAALLGAAFLRGRGERGA